MPATRRSQRSRIADLQMHEALVSGLSPEQVAAQFKQPVELVLAAQRRVMAERAKLSPEEALRQEHLEFLRAARKLAMAEFRSAQLEEVSTKSSLETAKEGRRVERTTRKKPASASYLRAIIACVALEDKLAARAAPAPAPAPAAVPPAPAAPAPSPAPAAVPAAKLPALVDPAVMAAEEESYALLPPDSNLRSLVTITSSWGRTERIPLNTLHMLLMNEHPGFAEYQQKMAEATLGQKLPFMDPHSPFYWKKSMRQHQNTS